MPDLDGTPQESANSLDTEDFGAYERARYGTEEPKEEASEAAEPEKVEAEPEPAPESDPDENQELPDEEPVKGKRLNKRFAQLTAKIRELEAQVASKEPGAASPQPKEEKEDPEPNPDAFDDYEKFVEAKVHWKIRKEEAVKAKLAAEHKAKAEAEKVISEYANRVKELAKQPDYADYGLKVTPLGEKLHPAIQEAIMTDENGPKVAYQVASDARLFERLQNMTLPQAIRELGKLSAKFDAPVETKPPVSKAPAPVKPVSSPAASPEKSLDEITDFSEYEKKRLAQLRRR